MKKVGYSAIRGLVKCLLHLYFGKIKVYGISNIPKDKPVLFLPNHQNAFLDTILIATKCNRSPYFLTRSDVFKSPVLKPIFAFCKMIPIFRMRDGISSLKHNQQTFDSCSLLLKDKEAVVIFPEANHNLERRVRPLSKGFTRILSNTLEKYPNLDIQLIPVGVNYKNAADFPDRAAVYYGKPIAIQSYYNKNDVPASMNAIKALVSANLKKLTTHIEPIGYDETLNKLTAIGVDFLNPAEVNNTILNLDHNADHLKESQNKSPSINIQRLVFNCLNLPVILLWNNVKLKIKEVEFKSTFRFAFGVLFYPIYLSFLFVIGSLLFNPLVAAFIAIAVFGYTLIFTKTN